MDVDKLTGDQGVDGAFGAPFVVRGDSFEGFSVTLAPL